jgi:four helix bundle protein
MQQLLRSSTSVAANYRAAARSKAEFISKLGVVIEEADEANQLLLIFSASRSTAKI